MVSASTNNLNPHADTGHHPPAPPVAAVATASTSTGPSGQAYGGTPPPRSTTGPAGSNFANIAVVALRALRQQQQRAQAECNDFMQRLLPTEVPPSPSQRNAPPHGQQQRPSPDNGGDSKSTQKRKRKSGRKAKKKDTDERQPAGTGATFYPPGSVPSGAWTAVPATTSPSTNPRAARGRGREATLPAWMTATQETPPGGLQQQAGPGTDSRMPGPSGSHSSGPQQSARTKAHGDNKTKNESGPNDKKTQGRGATTLASAAWPTDYHQETSTTVAGNARGALLGTTVPSRACANAAPGGFQQQPQLASPRVPRPLPAGLSSSRPEENNQIAAGTSTTQSAWPSPAKLESSDGNAIIAGPAPAATAESNHRATEHGWVAAVGAFHGQEASTTAWAGSGSGPSRPKRNREEELTTTEITTRLRNPSKAPGQQQKQQTPDEMMDMVRRMASMGIATVPKKKKLTLDASSEPKVIFNIKLNNRAVARVRVLSFTPAVVLAYPVEHHNTLWVRLPNGGNPDGCGCCAGARNKKIVALIATRARFRIIHHHALPSQQQLVLYDPPTSNIASGRSGATRSNQSSWGPPARAPLAIKPSTWTTPKPPPPPPSPLVVLDGTDIALTYWRTDDRWSALQPLLAIQFFKEWGVPCVAFLPRERVCSVTLQDGGSPTSFEGGFLRSDLVHKDMRRPVVGVRAGSYSLLTFGMPRPNPFNPVGSSPLVTDFYTAFHEARSRRAISEIPQGANASLFILKRAIEHNAYVVTNAKLSGHIASPATLASLGQTKNELQSYLSRSHVRYTFAGDDFTPDPEAPLIKMFAKQASGAN
ncbi:unnamed protein product [Ectocarpus sp. CCAP 1310/34]|nr:unnamed protein product [Ectocarpus sp. CCAP 1310/34]